MVSFVIMVESVKKCVLPYFMAPPASGGPKRVKYRNTEYRSLGILTEPNNTEPNHIVYENKGILLLYIFYCIFMQHFFHTYL